MLLKYRIIKTRGCSMRRFLVALAFAFSCFCLAGNVLGQVQITSGSIQGTVVDEKGGAVVDAVVEARNLDTNLLKTVMTDSDGRFAFLSLPPGRYTITISKTGFATISQTDATLTVGQAMSLPVTMKVSATQEKIEVSATPEAVDTISTSSSSTLNETAVSETPILGRKFENLLTLTPGVSIVQGPDGDEINFNGQRGIFNNISLDGGDYNNGFFGEQMGGQRAAIDITLDAVKEFQVVASGANAEFGRTAGGVVNVITKSGTNNVHGSVFYFQRLEALASSTSDGKPLDGFKREQFGGTMGGPIKKDKLFFFGSGEGVREDLTRSNLSPQLGTTACPVTSPVFNSNITGPQISANSDCQRLVLLSFLKAAPFNEDDGLPVSHLIRNGAAFGRGDYNLNANNQISASYNFDWSKNTNQTFDVPTYGTTANGIEGPSKIQAINTNWFSTISSTKLNEAHFTYSRENRPRSVVNPSSVPDTSIGSFGSSLSFRVGQPFFLEPKSDELFWHTDIRDNFSIVHGSHTIKLGGEWLHSVNTQVFRGFFAKPEQIVPATCGIRLGHSGRRKISPPGELGHFQCAAEHADTGRINHNEWSTTTVDRWRHISRRRYISDVSQYGTQPHIGAGDVSRVCRCTGIQQELCEPADLRSECRLRTTAHAKHVCLCRLRLGSGCAFDPIRKTQSCRYWVHHSCDRDERHRFNFYTYAKLPAGFTGDIRMQAHSAQPITDVANPAGGPSGPPCSITNSKFRFVNGVDCGRNHLRKDNAYFSFDFALDRAFHIGERLRIIPKLEIFNLFNNKNNVNSLTTPGFINFDGFLREGVGDPRQAQLSARFEF